MNVVAMIIMSLLGTTDYFDVQRIWIGAEHGAVHLANCDGDARAEIAFVADDTLNWFEEGQPIRKCPFPPGTRAYDIAPIEKDEAPVLVAMTDKAVFAAPLFGQSGDFEPLFEISTAFSPASTSPEPRVLVVKHEELPALLLPVREGWELRRADGTLLEKNAGQSLESSLQFSRPFTAWAIDPAQAGPPGSLEGFVNRVVELQTDFGVVDGAVPSLKNDSRKALPRAGQLNYANWPWFPLQTGENMRTRVLYALSAPGEQKTVIRIRKTADEQGERLSSSDAVGPERGYPGRLIRHDPMPDFNGDGYADLALWQNESPSGAWEPVPRAIASGTWRVLITVHLYAPGKERFEPRPDSVMACDVPLPWLWSMEEGSPIRHVSFTDVNADGRSDLVLSNAESSLLLWVRGEDRFESKPTRAFEFPEAIEEMVFARPLAPNQPATLAFRGMENLFVLWPLVNEGGKPN